LLSLLGILLSIFCVIILIHIVEKSLFSWLWRRSF
jgi:hypothetical protein